MERLRESQNLQQSREPRPENRPKPQEAGQPQAGHRRPQEQSGFGYCGCYCCCHPWAPGVAGAGKEISEFPISLSHSFGESLGPGGRAGTRLLCFLMAGGLRGGTMGLTVTVPFSAGAGEEQLGEE